MRFLLDVLVTSFRCDCGKELNASDLVALERLVISQAADREVARPCCLECAKRHIEADPPSRDTVPAPAPGVAADLDELE